MAEGQLQYPRKRRRCHSAPSCHSDPKAKTTLGTNRTRCQLAPEMRRQKKQSLLSDWNRGSIRAEGLLVEATRLNCECSSQSQYAVATVEQHQSRFSLSELSSQGETG